MATFPPRSETSFLNRPPLPPCVFGGALTHPCLEFVGSISPAGVALAIPRGTEFALLAAPASGCPCAAPAVTAAVGTGVAVAGLESRWMRPASCP